MREYDHWDYKYIYAQSVDRRGEVKQVWVNGAKYHAGSSMNLFELISTFGQFGWELVGCSESIWVMKRLRGKVVMDEGGIVVDFVEMEGAVP